MAKQLQLRRGTEAQNNAFTGAVGELTVDTDNNKLRLHDGVTQGGHEVGKGSSLPDQTGQSGKVLSTDGTEASWVTVPSDPTKADTSELEGKADKDLSNVSGSPVERIEESGDGFIRYSSGIQICWGVAHGGNWVSYPKQFSSPPSVTTEPITTGYARVTTVTQNETTRFFCHTLTTGESTAYQVDYYWQAIGRWK